jgi:3D (Asp-Asp-Asp) domain-containing protein
MKHFAKSVIISSALLCAFLTPGYSAQASPQDPSGVKVQVNDVLLNFPDAQPFVDSLHKLQVPIRFLTNHIGYQANYELVGSEYKVILNNHSNTLSFTTGDHTATINGKPINLESAPQFIDGTVYISFRAIADSLKMNIQWDSNNRIAILDEDNKYHAPAWYAPRFEKVIAAKATAYTGDPSENGGHPSIDYFGNPLQVGTIAVDPSVIPLGSKVYIEGYSYDGLPANGMYATATDTGGAVKGNKIDIYVPDSKVKAQKFGIQQVKIYILKG